MYTKKIIAGVLLAAGVVVGGSIALAQGNYVTLSAFSGTPATVLTVSGGGWQSGDTVDIYFGSASGTPAATTTVSSGMFSTQVSVPPDAPQGQLAVYAVDATTQDEANNSFYVIPLSPKITSTASPNTPFGTITTSGTGFLPNEEIFLEIGSSNTTTPADQNGSFSNISLPIPNLPSALYILSAAGFSSHAKAMNYVWINSFYPSASPSSWYVQPGGTLSFSGSGFAPNEAISISTGGQTVATTSADASGSFSNSGSFVVPLSLRNSAPTFTLNGALSGASVKMSITVGNLYPYAYPSSWYLLPGSPVTFHGGGFGPGETVNIYQNTTPTPVATFTAGADGSFSGVGTTTVPFHQGPSVTYTLVGAASDVSAYTSISVGAFYPGIIPSAYYSSPGGVIGLTGSGFAPNETVTIQAGSVATTTTADSSGNISVSGIRLPYMGGITLTISAKGSQSGATATVGVTLGQYYPLVSPSTYYSLPGNTVIFSGSGFAPSETLTVSGTSTTITTTATGTFSGVPMMLPYNASASQTFTFTGNTSGTPASATITVGSRTVGLTASTYYVPRGSTVILSGTGFVGSETVTASGTGIASISTTTNSDGTFSLPVAMPRTGSSETVTITGSVSGASASVTITLAQLSPWFTLSTYWGQGGSPLTIQGGGYMGGETVVFSANGTAFASTTTDTSGNINLSTQVPFAPSGSITITGTGAQSGASAQASMTVAPVYTNLQLGSYAVAPGNAINFIGSGYLPNEPVAVTTDRTGSTTVDTFSTDASGSFNDSSFIVPAASTPGNMTVTVTGEHSFDQKSIVLYVQ